MSHHDDELLSSDERRQLAMASYCGAAIVVGFCMMFALMMWATPPSRPGEPLPPVQWGRVLGGLAIQATYWWGVFMGFLLLRRRQRRARRLGR